MHWDVIWILDFVDCHFSLSEFANFVFFEPSYVPEDLGGVNVEYLCKLRTFILLLLLIYNLVNDVICEFGYGLEDATRVGRPRVV